MRAASRASCLLLVALAAACSGTPAGGGTCSFTRADHPAGSGPSVVAIGDFDRDGRPDLAVTNNTSGTVSVLLGSGGGSFGGKVDYSTGSFPYAVAVADLDGDGFLDLAVGNGGDSVSVLPGSGNGAFQPRTDVAVGANPFSVAVADLDGNGLPDLAVANWTSGTVSVLLHLCAP